MFEDKYDRSAWDEQYAYGYQTGFGIGRAETRLIHLIWSIRDKKETEEMRREYILRLFDKGCAYGQYEELCTFVEKYRNLKTEALIRRVLMETEYCYF